MSENLSTFAMPYSRFEFDLWLRIWYDQTDRDTIGDVDTYGGRAFLWVQADGHTFHLNADTKRHGVRRYLSLIHNHGYRCGWSVVTNTRGRANKVAFGPDQEKIPGFYLYLA